MKYFPYSRFDFNSNTTYYSPLSFKYDGREQVRVIISNVEGVAYSLEYGSDYTLEGDKIKMLKPSTLEKKYKITPTKIFAVRFSGICDTPEFQYGVYLDVKKVQRTLESMALQLAEVQMNSVNSIKIAYEEWHGDGVDPTVQIPTKTERAGKYMAFGSDGRVLMVAPAELAYELKQFIKDAKEPVFADTTCYAYSFTSDEELLSFKSTFTVTQGTSYFTPIEKNTTPTEKGTFSLFVTSDGLENFDVDLNVIKGTESSTIKDDSSTTLDVVIRYVDLDGYSNHIEKTISLSKATSGKDGVDGVDGQDGYSYTILIESSNGNVFRLPNVSTTLSCVVLKNNEDITDTLEDSKFCWKRVSSDITLDEQWNTSSKALYHKSVDITGEDCIGRTVFECEVDL